MGGRFQSFGNHDSKSSYATAAAGCFFSLLITTLPESNEPVVNNCLGLSSTESWSFFEVLYMSSLKGLVYDGHKKTPELEDRKMARLSYSTLRSSPSFRLVLLCGRNSKASRTLGGLAVSWCFFGGANLTTRKIQNENWEFPNWHLKPWVVLHGCEMMFISSVSANGFILSISSTRTQDPLVQYCSNEQV